MGGDRDKRFAIDDEDKRREQARKALRLLAELEQHEGEPGKATLVGFAQMSDSVGAPAGSRTEEVLSAMPWSRPTHATFDDFRATGLREVLAQLSDRPLRNATIAAADRSIATRVATTPAVPSAAGTAMWRAAERRAATLYRHAQDSGEVASDDPVVDEALARCGSGQPLPASLRAQMERELGISLARVRVHTDAIAAAAAKAVRAHAFTVGEDIFFADGTYAPDSREGRKLLAHELTHVVQAQQGRTSTGGSGIRVSEPGEALEREADAVAERVMQAPRRPTWDATRRAPTARNARYAPAPSQSLLLRQAHHESAPTGDGRPFKEYAEARNKTKWRLRDDDVFVCVAGPDGSRLASEITVSAERNPKRWKALGTKWAAAAPGRTWPRAPKHPGKTPKRPKSPVAPHSDSNSNRDGESIPTEPPTGTPLEIGTVLNVLPPLKQFLFPADLSEQVYFADGHLLDLQGTIRAPALHLDHLHFRSVFHLGPVVFSGLVIHGDLTGIKLTFTRATFGRGLIEGDKRITVGATTLKGGVATVDWGGSAGGDVHFDEAKFTGIQYPGAPPTDLVLTNSTLFAFADSFETLKGGPAPALAHSTATPQHGRAEPEFTALAGTRVKVQLDGLNAFHNPGSSSKDMGSFSRFEAKLVKDGPGQGTAPAAPLASIIIEGVGVRRIGSELQGSIKRVHVTGSADFVLALLESPAVLAQKAVRDVVEKMTNMGLLPTAGTQLTLENVHLGASGSAGSVRTDIVLHLDVPGSLKLLVELRGVVMTGDLAAQTGHMDFGKVLLVVSDRKGPIAALMAEGNADMSDKKLAGALRHVEGSGDMNRIAAALRSVKIPPAVDAALAAVKKQVSLNAAFDVDGASETGADDKTEQTGNAHARIEVPGAGSLDLSVVGFHRSAAKDEGALAAERIEAHLTPPASANRKATGDVATLIITGAHAATASGKTPRTSATMIDLRGDAGKAAEMVRAIHTQVTSLPPMLQEAAKLVYTLDLGAASAPAPSSGPARASEPVPDASVRANAHLALVIPRVGTIDATVRGFHGSSRKGSVRGDFETFDLALLTTAGQRAARIVIRGGSGSFEPATKKDAAKSEARLDDVVLEGNSQGLLDAVEQHAELFDTAPAAIRTAFEYLRAHHISLATTVTAHATDLAVTRRGDQIDGTSGTITARVTLPGVVATAALTKGSERTGVWGFELLEVRINDSAATLQIHEGQWTAADASGTAKSISITGDGQLLHAILEERMMRLLPAEIGAAISKYSAMVVSATATDPSVRRTDNGAIAKVSSLDLNGSITFTDDGKRYICDEASIHVSGAHLDGSADSQKITAESVVVRGRFEQVGERTTRGKLAVTTGPATLTRGTAGSGLVTKEIHAEGELDVGAGNGPKLKGFMDTTDTAVRNAPALRSLALDIYAPISPGTYGNKPGVFGHARRIRVSSGASLHLHGSVTDGMVTALVASTKGEISASFGNKFQRVALKDQKLDIKSAGWLETVFREAQEKASKELIEQFEMKFDVAGFVAWAADMYRPYITDDLLDEDDGASWANEQRREREESSADLEKRNAEAKTDPNGDPADVPKPYGALMKDFSLSAITGTLTARIARAEAVGFSGIDGLSGEAQLRGKVVGGKLWLDGDATVNIGRGTAQVKELRTGGVGVTDGSNGGTKVSFDSFHVDELSWDPAARTQKPESK